MTAGRWLRLLLAGVLAVVVGLPLVTLGQVWYTARQDDARRSDAIVVLGAAQFDGRPSKILAARLDHAHTLLAGGIAPRIVTVGGSRPGDRFSEAEAGERYLTEHGVAADKVLPVGHGTDTLDSLTAAADVLRRHDWSTVVLVSDPWHLARCQAMASDLGLTASTSPTRTGPTAQADFDQRRYVLRETGALLYYRVEHLLGQAP